YKSRTFFAVTPRVLLALLVGMAIAVPVTLRIFGPEVNAQIVAAQENAQYVRSVNVSKRYQVQIDEIQNEIIRSRNGVAADGQRVNCQLYGGSGCPRLSWIGKGPVSQADEQYLKSDTAQVAALEKNLSSLRNAQMNVQTKAMGITGQNQKG